MSKSVLISIRPEWCQLIVDGKKTVEVRKTRPKLETPFKCYIYCTYGMGLINRFDEVYPNMLLDRKVTKKNSYGNCCNGKVIGEFICDRIYQYSTAECIEGVDITTEEITRMSCLTHEELVRYENSEEPKDFCLYLMGLYCWHISDLVIYEKPKELSEFVRRCKAYGKDTGRCWDCSKSVGDEHDCGENGMLEMKWPPQTWCYVEELEGCGADGYI